jgi:hypothetical protein
LEQDFMPQFEANCAEALEIVRRLATIDIEEGDDLDAELVQ